jgi:serine/threonine-protein kinase
VLALAMAEAEREHVVHRDLKLANVLITPDGVPVITNFGVALLLGAERLTEPGVAVSTLEYVLSEQVEGRRAKERGKGISPYSDRN